MAIDIYPYSQRQAGQVSDNEHELLWSGTADGIPPGEATNALQVDFTGGNWSVQPGKILIAGHVLHIDTVQSGALPAGSTATRRCVVVAQVNHSTTPWTYGADIVLGTPGAGRPALSTSLTGKYQIALRSVDIAPSGAITGLYDERPHIRDAGLVLPSIVEAGIQANESTTLDEYRNGDILCETTFTAPPSGRILVYTYARMSSPTAAAICTFTLRRGFSGGTIIEGPQQDNGVTIAGSLGSGQNSRYLTGLIPYETYYIRTAHRSTQSGEVANIYYRRLIVLPQV